MNAVLLAALAALGNTLYAWAQHRAGARSDNPLVFGAASLATAALLLAGLAVLLPSPAPLRRQLSQQLPWIAIAALGYVLLFSGLFFLYQRYGAGHYALYASLAIVATALCLPWLLGAQVPGVRQWLACATAFATVMLLQTGSAPR